MSDAIDQNALYPIREVARLTGVNPITLRAWERRYNLIEPVRTESGHRLYTQEHIDFLHETLRLMEEGIPISRIQAVISEASPRQTHTSAVTPSSDKSHALLEKIVQAAGQLQVQALERLLDRVFADYSLNPLRILLAEVDAHLQQQDNSAVSLVFWRSSVLRRIQVRLHSLYTQPLLPSKRVVIYKALSTPAYLAALVTLFCFEQGYQALAIEEGASLEQVLTAAKSLSIQAVIFVDQDASATDLWRASFAKYASMRTWLFGSEQLAEMQPASVNCELRAWSQWFTPLGL
ncbi:MAG: MerR family transcriptional regulator [Thiopseudomonas sp.]|nr:MerR family transcriptional regulator [Thiopseudomonas sp.]